MRLLDAARRGRGREALVGRPAQALARRLGQERARLLSTRGLSRGLLGAGHGACERACVRASGATAKSESSRRGAPIDFCTFI